MAGRRRHRRGIDAAVFSAAGQLSARSWNAEPAPTWSTAHGGSGQDDRAGTVPSALAGAALVALPCLGGHPECGNSEHRGIRSPGTEHRSPVTEVQRPALSVRRRAVSRARAGQGPGYSSPGPRGRRPSSRASNSPGGLAGEPGSGVDRRRPGHRRGRQRRPTCPGGPRAGLHPGSEPARAIATSPARDGHRLAHAGHGKGPGRARRGHRRRTCGPGRLSVRVIWTTGKPVVGPYRHEPPGSHNACIGRGIAYAAATEPRDQQSLGSVRHPAHQRTWS